MSSVVVTGFIGLGSQGGPMAQRMMKAGYPLRVWARRAEAAEPFVSGGAEFVEPEEMGATCDHIGVCVVDDAGTRQVCDRLIPAMREGSLLVVHATILPDTCEELAAVCAGRGVAFLDAPVSGGGPAAEAGELTVMCGGSDEALQQARPVLESFAGKIFHVGPAGAGQRAKIVNNAMLAANMGIAHAALCAGERLGMDRTALSELVLASSGRSYGAEICARLPEPSAFAHGAPLLDKDVKLLSAISDGSSESGILKSAARFFLDQAVVTEEAKTDL